MSLPDPALLPTLLTHLSAYGECSQVEVDRSLRGWLGVLTEAGWLEALDSETYTVSPAFLALPQYASEPERLRRVCFAVPGYRRYLTSVAAESLVTAAQLGELRNQVETWIVQNLIHLAPEINTILDEIESDQGRLVERAKGDVSEEFRKWHQKHEPFAVWDAALLGHSGTPEQLFTVVLSRADSFTCSQPAEPAGEKSLALLIDFDLPQDDAGQLALPALAPWTRARRSVYSSLPFYTYDGTPRFDTQQPALDVWRDVLAQQPYYRAVLRCAIAAHFSRYGTSEVMLHAPGDLGEAQIQRDGRPGVTLAAILPDLVAAMGYQPGTRPSLTQLGRILQHWIALSVIERRDGYLQLDSNYRQTLHEPNRAQMLLRGQARPERENFEKRLKESV